MTVPRPPRLITGKGSSLRARRGCGIPLETSVASAITKINGTSKYLTATRDPYSSDITVTYERKRNSKSGWLRWDGTNQALTVFVLGSVAEEKYSVVVDSATEKAAFEHSRKTVTPEDVVRDFLQELTGV